MFREFRTRIGIFFILIGIGTFVLFLASGGAGSANFDYLFWAVLAVIVGVFLRRRRAPPAPASRFSALRRFRGTGRDRKEHE